MTIWRWISSTTSPTLGSRGGKGVSRSFLTLRYQPVRFITFEAGHNYFRLLPTFDTRLIATGLLQQYLFQGLSGGVRVELPYRVSVYTDIGRSSASSDPKASLNTMYGVSWANILGTGLRADARYTRFDSAFGAGTYQMLSLSKRDHRPAAAGVAIGPAGFQVLVYAGRPLAVRHVHAGLVFSSALLAGRRLDALSGWNPRL